MAKYQQIPFLQIRSDAALLYHVTQPQPPRNNQYKFVHPTYTGKMKAHSQKRVMRAVDMLLQRNPGRRIWNPIVQKHHDFQIAFVTLTIPEPKPVPASVTHAKLLQPFLRTARRKWGVTEYIWKCELQSRGQVHYHLTWPQFIDLTLIRNEWNRLLKKHRLSDSYARRYGNFHPNSTDVHAVWKVGNLKAYLAKYIAKEEAGKAAIDAKVWDCSKELKVKPFSVVAHTYHQQVIDDAMSAGVCKRIDLERCSLFKMKNPAGVLTNGESLAYKQFLS